MELFIAHNLFDAAYYDVFISFMLQCCFMFVYCEFLPKCQSCSAFDGVWPLYNKGFLLTYLLTYIVTYLLEA